MNESTIAALATPPGTGGISIVRMSGPQAISIASRLFRHRSGQQSEFQSHRLYYGHLADPLNGNPIDEVLLAVMRSPRTYTREDVVEIHSHGSPAAVQAILQAVLQSGAVQAEPGEFTRRAFLNGRIDLTQAEAVMDLIHARSEQALSFFAAQMNGSLRKEIERLRDDCVAFLAHIEARIDFPDDMEEDLDLSRIGSGVRDRIAVPVRMLVQSFAAGCLMRDGLNVAIVGRPNVGKSSLMNRLMCRERAIVTPYPGTTRDAIEGRIELDGLAVTLWDTAGLRRTDEPIEAIGIEKTVECAANSNLLLFVMEAQEAFTADDRAILADLKAHPMIYVLNKVDLVQPPVAHDSPPDWPSHPAVLVSALSGLGLAELTATIRRSIGWDSQPATSRMVINLRQKALLESCLQAVLGASDQCMDDGPAELVSVHLKEALANLDAILGTRVPPDVLEHIFGRFCIGK
jgi:tRNA modification GTPase